MAVVRLREQAQRYWVVTPQSAPPKRLDEDRTSWTPSAGNRVGSLQSVGEPVTTHLPWPMGSPTER